MGLVSSIGAKTRIQNLLGIITGSNSAGRLPCGKSRMLTGVRDGNT